MEEMRCVVERITYSNEETGFCVLQAKVDERRDLVCLVGSIAGVRPGSILNVSGQWKLNNQYGPQFAVERWEETLPTEAVGIRKYLASGAIRGIGPHSARAIVHAFGDDTIRIIDEEPERLMEVSGIGHKRVEMIRAAWDAQKEIRGIMLFLQSHDVGASHAAKIYRQYGVESVRTVRENPYRLADDIRGIGFLTADRIALKLGFDTNGYARCRSGVIYSLNRLAEEGHCFATRNQLKVRVLKLLGIDVEVISMTLDHMLSSGDLIRETSSSLGEVAIYLPPFFHSEVGVARRLRSILAVSSPMPPGEASDAEDENVTYNDQQRMAIRTAAESKCMVLTGGPGTGKTTALLGILRVFRRQGLKTLLAAPTGRAAKRMTEATGMEAKTIHRLLEYSPTEGYRHNEYNRLKGDALIVDELSMVDVVLMYNLLKAVPDRMRLILVGDADQLPSIGAGSVLKDLILSGVVPVIHLSQIFRQAHGSQIIQNAHRVNRGEMPSEASKRDGDYFFIPEENAGKLAELIVSLCAKRLSGYYGVHPINDIQVLTPMVKGELGTHSLNALLQKRLNPSAGPVLHFGETEFHRHDKVMQIRNNYDKEVFNGDIGYVSTIDTEDRELEVVFDGRSVFYDATDLEELTLAYACTVHKSQGSEYPIVVMPVSEKHRVMLQRNLIYTAMTRAKRILVLAGTRKALGYAIKNNKVASRNTMLAERLCSQDGFLPGARHDADAITTQPCNPVHDFHQP